MAVLGPGGSLAAAKQNEKNKNPGGKSVGAGTQAISGGLTQTQARVIGPGASVAASKTPGGLTGRVPGRTDASGDSDAAPTITRVGTPSVLPAGATMTPNATDTTDITGRPKYQGTSPYVSDPSAGQIAGALLGVVPGGAGLVNRALGLGMSLLGGENPVTGDDGGALGREIDGARGVKPGPVTGYTGNSVASSTNSRGDRPSDDSRLLDRAATAATAALTGDASPALDASVDYSGVRLSDRRKPRDLSDQELISLMKVA